MNFLNCQILSSESNTKQALWVGISSFSSFMLAIVSSAIFSRYFDKTEYGTYRQIVYIYSTLLTIFAAGLPSAYAYFLPKLNKSQGKEVISKLTNLFIITGAIFSLFLFITSGLIADILKNPELERGLKLFSPIPILMMPTLGVEGIYTAIRKTYILAIYTIITRLGMLAFITLPVIILKGTYETAIIGWIFSSLLSLFLALYFNYKPFRGLLTETASTSYMMILNYSVPIMIASLAGTAILSADQFFISRYFGTEIFADFSNGFVPLPFVPMITGSVHAIFVPLFSNLIEKDNGNIFIAQAWKNGVNKAIIILYPILIFFMFFAKEVIYVLYGPLYDKSHIYFRLAMILNFSMPYLYYSILLATGRTRIYAKLHIVAATLIWSLGYIVCKVTNSSICYVLLSVLLGLVLRSVGLYFAAKSIEARFIDLLDIKRIFEILVYTIIICFVTKLGIKLITDNMSFGLIIGCATYIGLIFFVDKWLNLGILNTAFSIIKKN